MHFLAFACIKQIRRLNADKEFACLFAAHDNASAFPRKSAQSAFFLIMRYCLCAWIWFLSTALHTLLSLFLSLPSFHTLRLFSWITFHNINCIIPCNLRCEIRINELFWFMWPLLMKFVCLPSNK